MSTIRGFERAAKPSWWLVVLLALFTLLAGCSDSPAPAPTISVQPSDTAAAAGNAATLSVTASGPDINYQWQSSSDNGSTWVTVAGATSASHTTPILTLADNGRRYRVVVSAAGISLNSSAVTLTVTVAVVAPAISVAPTAQAVTAPANAVFTVTATGTALAYQWQRSTDSGVTFVNIAGATAASYDVGATDMSMNGQRYRVVVSNTSSSVTSAAATLTVNAAPAAPAFTTQPQGQSVTAGSAAAFTVAATGTPTPSLQWQRSTDGGASFTNISGATAETYNTGATTLVQSGERFRVVATNSAGSATSNVATLTVTAAPAAPVITSQPTAQTVTAPASATFSSAATGVPTPTWQWQLSTNGGSTFANITGATSASYSTPATVVGDSGKRYRAVATNASGSGTTNAVALTVTAPPVGKSWGTAVLIETANAGNADYPQVAIDANGNAIAVWNQSDGTRDNIWANRYTAGQGWGTAGLIQTDTARAGLEPQVAIDANGNAVAVWVQFDGTFLSIAANRYTAAQGWGTEAAIGSENLGPALEPQVSIDANGNAIAVWRQSDGTRDNIWANRYTAGQGWGAAERIETDNGGAFSPQVAIDANGNAIAVWNQSDGTRDNIWANRYTAGQGWGTAGLIETDNGAAYGPQVAIDANGNAIAVWRQFDGTRFSIWANRYTASQGWGTAVLLETDNLSNADSHQIAIDANGNALAVWVQLVGATRQFIWVNRYTVGQGWGTAAGIDTANPGDVAAPQIAINANGNALAVWAQGDGTRQNIWANRYTAGQGWGTAEIIETNNVGTAVRPQVAIDANGNAVAVWIQQDGLYFNVWANTFR